MKKIVSILISVITAFSLTACVAKEEDPVKASQSFPWIIANDSPADTVTGIFTNKFVEEVIEWTNSNQSLSQWYYWWGS